MANFVKYHIISVPVMVNMDRVCFILGNKIVFDNGENIKVDENFSEVVAENSKKGGVLSSKSR